MIDKVSVAVDLVRSELKRAAARVTLTIACQGEATQHQQAPQEVVVNGSITHPDSQLSPEQNKGTHLPYQQCEPEGQDSQGQKRGLSLGHQQQQRGQEEGLPSGELQPKLVLVELLSDNYQDVMTKTLHEVVSDLKLCRQLLQQCKESFSSLVSFYGENAQAFANDAVFWSDVTIFVDRFTACQKQLRKQIQVKWSGVQDAFAWKLQDTYIMLSQCKPEFTSHWMPLFQFCVFVARITN